MFKLNEKFSKLWPEKVPEAKVKAPALSPEESFLNSLDISPAQRRDLRSFIKDLQDPKEQVRFLRDKSKSWPKEVMHSEYIRELAQKKILEHVSTDKGPYGLGEYTEVMDTFGIEEGFFKQEAFLKIRQGAWLDRLGHGVRINDSDRLRKDSWGNPEDKNPQELAREKKEEELQYGEFSNSGLKPEAPVVREAALQGIVYGIFYSGFSRRPEDEPALREEYKKYFKITDAEIEAAVIERIKKESFDNIKKLDELRQANPFVDNFLKSDEAKEFAKQVETKKLIKDGLSSELMTYFGISETELNQVEIKEGQKQSVINRFQERIKSGEKDYIMYDLERASKVLEASDWQALFADPNMQELFIYAIARGLRHSFERKNNLKLLSSINMPSGLVKAGSREALVYLSAYEENFKKNDFEELKEISGLSEAETKEAFSLGIASGIGQGLGIFDIERRQQEAGIETLVDSPAIQAVLKETYLEKVTNVDYHNLETIDSQFKINWQTENRPARNEALKKALTNPYQLSKFNNLSSLRQFVDEHSPERHQIFFLSDPEIKQAAEKMLMEFPFYYDYRSADKDFVSGFASYFNLSAEKISAAVKEKIASGNFAGHATTQHNLEKYFPDLDYSQDNEKCLALKGPELVKQAFESKDWEELKAIKKYPDAACSEAIAAELAIQEKNLVDGAKSPAVRAYAIEAIAHLSQNMDILENNYLLELTDIYSKVDPNKLINLFQRKSNLFNALPEDKRTALFDELINQVDTNSDRATNPCVEIIKRDSIVYLNPEQTTKTLETSYFIVAAEGLSAALKNKLDIPQHLLDTLYRRFTDNQGQEAAEFSQSLVELLNLGINNSAVENIVSSEALLKEIAANPQGIELIKEIVNQVPGELLNSNWSDVYRLLKESTPEEFASRVELLNQVKPYKHSWWISKMSFANLIKRLESYTPAEQKQFSELNLQNKPVEEFNKENWAPAINTYISATEEENRLRLNNQRKAETVDVFSGSYKDVALTGLQTEWNSFLQAKSAQFTNPNLFMVSRAVEDAGGCGNLKHVEALANLVSQFEQVLENEKVAARTKMEIRNLLLAQENKISQEKWSQDERSEFYNLSHDIIEAAPSLYSSFAPLLEQLSPKEMKIFLKDNFPLFQAELITIQEMKGRNGEASYRPRDLVAIKQAVENLTGNLKTQPTEKNKLLAEDKARLIEVIKSSFENRFGILKVPAEFSKENLRSVQNGIRYLGNINERNATKEAILAYYLGLELNGEWEKFRGGAEIKPEEYLAGKQLETLQPILEAKQKSYNLPLEVAGIPAEKAARFQELLQMETSSNMIGSVQTVDIKLANIKRNIDELSDPDIYPKQSEKDIMALLTKEGKAVGATLAKTYASLSGKNLELSDQEKLIQTRLAIIYHINSWSKSEVESIQNQIQPFSLVTNMIGKLEEEQVEENIKELQNRLMPADKIIEIFNRLGEDFKPASGAVALSRDLSYLESLVVKEDQKLSPEERRLVGDYLEAIKEKMKDLEITLDKVKDYFTKLQKSSHLNNQPLLKERLGEIEKIVNSTDSNAVITSQLTKNFNLIIENMRQCLGCLRKEANNDTNLAFGDYNKFFLINQSEKEKGSMSDEIVFFVPVRGGKGETSMSFVMDQVYGSKLPDVLVANVSSVFKKYAAIKKEIPEARLSVSVSTKAMSSVGLNAELLKGRLKEALPDLAFATEEKDLTATVTPSVLSDNYIEFGSSSGRVTGELSFSGLVIG